MTKNNMVQIEREVQGRIVVTWLLQIMEELGENGLRIYTFPTEDATVAEINNKMNVSNAPMVKDMDM